MNPSLKGVLGFDTAATSKYYINTKKQKNKNVAIVLYVMNECSATDWFVSPNRIIKYLSVDGSNNIISKKISINQ